MSLLDLTPDNPYRPPDWRWRLAARLLHGGRPVPRRWADPDLADALAAQKHLARDPRKGRPPKPLPARLADVGPALEVYATPSRLRTVLEARLIAGQAPPAVAAAVGLPAGVVARYAALFYDVAGRLDCRSFVAHTLLKTGMPGAVAPGDDDAVLKHFAALGLPCLEAALRQYDRPQPPVPRRLRAAPREQLEDLREWLGVRGVVLTLTFEPATHWDKIRWLRLVAL